MANPLRAMRRGQERKRGMGAGLSEATDTDFDRLLTEQAEWKATLRQKRNPLTERALI